MHDQRSTVEFSVVVPLFNKRGYVVDAIHSVLAQTRGDFEVVVVDDGSSDGSLDVLRESIRDPRIILLQQKNQGVAAARNTGISAASGTYICFLDADDIWLPNKLEGIHRLFSSYPNAGFAATSYFEFNDSSNVPGYTQSFSESTLIDDFYARWTKFPFVFTSSIAVRRDVLAENNLSFPAGESWGEDQDLWFRLSEISPLAFSPAMLAGYRRGLTDNLSNKQPLDILPVYERLKYRATRLPPNSTLARQAHALFRKHARDVAISNLRNGNRLRSFSFVTLSDFGSAKFALTFTLDFICPKIVSLLKRPNTA